MYDKFSRQQLPPSTSANDSSVTLIFDNSIGVLFICNDLKTKQDEKDDLLK